MKRKLVTILIGCMTLGLFGCGSGLSDTTKRLTPQQSEDSEQNADHIGNEDQQAEADTTEKKAEDGSTETSFGYRYRYCQFALNLLQQIYEDGKNERQYRLQEHGHQDIVPQTIAPYCTGDDFLRTIRYHRRHLCRKRNRQ